jgi:threonyl-tRNA synthetase
MIETKEEVQSKFLVLYPSGEINEIKYLEDLRDLEDELLKNFIENDVFGRKPITKKVEISPHVKYMKKLEIADYEPASYVSHIRFYPKGL